MTDRAAPRPGDVVRAPAAASPYDLDLGGVVPPTLEAMQDAANADPLVIKGPGDAYRKLFRPMAELDREQFWWVPLDLSFRTMVDAPIVHAIGSRVDVSSHPLEVFGDVVRRFPRARGVICAHNHPDGELLAPSDADLEMTGRMVLAGEMIGVEVLDLLVVGGAGAVSCRRELRRAELEGEIDKTRDQMFGRVPVLDFGTIDRVHAYARRHDLGLHTTDPDGDPVKAEDTVHPFIRMLGGLS